MDPFVERIQAWQPFYATVAAACATLTGLLFVALSLNIDILKRGENTERMWLARQTFGEFLLVLMVALVFLVPGLGPFGLGVGLLCLGGALTVATLSAFRTNFKKRGTNVSKLLHVWAIAGRRVRRDCHCDLHVARLC